MARKILKNAGDFILEKLDILMVNGSKIDLTEIVTSINIYEDLFTNAISGTISFTDTNNLVYNGPIIGQERIQLKLLTPQVAPTEETVIDFTKNILYVNRVVSVTEINDSSRAIVLSFTTQDVYMNHRVRVSKSYSGEPSEIIKKIIRSPTLLDSKKKLFLEPTANNYKFIIPSMRPFNAINMIAQKCMSKTHQLAPTYFFYETCFGYHFRSIDSLFDEENVKARFEEHTAQVLNDKGEQDYVAGMENLIEFSPDSTQDSLINTRTGMYSSRIVLYNWYTKSITKKEYNYLDDFSKDNHAQKNAFEGSPNPLISEVNEFGNKRLSDFPDSVQYVQGTILDGVSSKNFYELEGSTHADYTNPYEGSNVDKWCMRRKSRLSQLQLGMKMKIEVIGRTNIQVGDLVEIRIPSVSTATRDKYNKYLSGRYLIRQLHHSFTMMGEQNMHKCHMTVIKDDVQETYPAIGTGSGGTALNDAGDSANQTV